MPIARGAAAVADADALGLVVATMAAAAAVVAAGEKAEARSVANRLRGQLCPGAKTKKEVSKTPDNWVGYALSSRPARTATAAVSESCGTPRL